ncbi:hypothetical protein D5086_027107 [Populus alba]|uniref:Uncharacterized protein n=1 Tax=Populus alba TaxID=43335 RepID=A0ACC4B3P6_POPAL
MLKVLLNQVVLGPSVIAVVFAWNNLWQGEAFTASREVSKRCSSNIALWAVPIQARVAFMSTGSIFLELLLVINNEQVDSSCQHSEHEVDLSSVKHTVR